MKTDKEYPATHSMETAWYCVDEDGNVGIFQIEDNGPVPEGYDYGGDPDSLFWYGFSSYDESMIRHLPLTPEQIEPLLIPKKELKKDWDNSYGRESNLWWNNVIIKIDMTKLPLLEKALSLNPEKKGHLNEKAVCLSEPEGLFSVIMNYNKKGVSLLEENDVIKAVYETPEFWLRESYDDDEIVNEDYKLYPVYVYWQNYWPYSGAASKYVEPRYPLKISQLPKELQDKAFRIPLKFKDTDRIQLAEYLPVKVSGCPEYVYDSQIWCELATSDESLMYYNQKTKAIIYKETMDKLIAEGKAEEFDWDKHRDLKK